MNRLYGKLIFNVLKEIETSLLVRCSDYACAEMINLATNYNFGVLKEDALLHFSFSSIFGLHNNSSGSGVKSKSLLPFLALAGLDRRSINIREIISYRTTLCLKKIVGLNQV